MPSSTILWAGTLTALHEYTDILRAGRPTYSDSSNSEPEGFHLSGNVAVVPIKGPLSHQDSWWQMTYTDIRNAVIEAAQHPEVEQILLDIGSGGGSVYGMAETASLIRYINDNIKPVVAYTGSMMASAAYVLASGAGKIYSNDMALVGSIGVIATHMDYSKALEMEGIRPTVIRAGKEKALAQPTEPLTEAAKAQIQDQVDTIYNIAVDNVAKYRGVSSDFARQHMANGKEFIGEEAALVKLTDGVISLDALMIDLQSKQKPGQGNGSNHTRMETSMARKKTLTPEMVAALAEGVSLETIPGTHQDNKAPGTPEDTKVPAVTPNADGTTPAPAAAVPEAPQAPAPAADIVAFLKSELHEKTAEAVKLAADNAALQGKLTSLEATHDGMRNVVASSINRMRIAMKGASMDLGGLPADVLLAEHAKVTKEFQATFPTGSMSAMSDPDDEEDEPAPISHNTSARLRAVKI